MQVVVVGGSGALGQSVLRALAADASLTRGDGQPEAVRRVIALDRVQGAHLFVDERIEYVRGDYAQPRFFARVMGTAIDAVFHLAACETLDLRVDLDGALASSIDTTRRVLEACQYQSAPPRLVFASSVAAIGATIGEAGAMPGTTEGVLCALSELLLAECSRQGIVDARQVRLPWLLAPFVEGSEAQDVAGRIVREALATGSYECPVMPQSPLWLTSPRAAAAALVHAHELSPAAWPAPRLFVVPGCTTSVAQLLDALGALDGVNAAPTVSFRMDPRLQAELDARPALPDVASALAAGFAPAPTLPALLSECCSGRGTNLKSP